MIEYGFVSPSEPISTPSSLNWTPAMPEPASELVAERETDVPEIVEPSEGAVNETDGAVVSTVQVTKAGDDSTCPKVSVARTVKVCESSERPLRDCGLVQELNEAESSLHS